LLTLTLNICLTSWWWYSV